MAKPIVAIVGRPNVGKSTLFNKLIGERRSIVEDVPGVTRDRIYAEAEWNERRFILIDTGGIEPKSEDTILKQMRIQAQVAIVHCWLCSRLSGGRAGLLQQVLPQGLLPLSWGCGQEPRQAVSGPNLLHMSLLGRRVAGNLRLSHTF